MFTSLIKWTKRRDEIVKTGREEYAALLDRLVTKDDLKPSDVDRLEDLHATHGAGFALTDAIAAVIAATKLRDDVAELQAAKAELAESAAAAEAHDMETGRVAEEQDAVLMKRETEADALASRESLARSNLAELQGLAQQLSIIESSHWKALGMEAAPVAVSVITPPLPVLQIAYERAKEAIAIYQKRVEHYPAERNVFEMTSAGMKPVSSHRTRLSERRLAKLMENKKAAFIAMHAAQEMAKVKPPVAYAYDGSVLTDIQAARDGLSEQGSETRVVEYRNAHQPLKTLPEVFAPDLSEKRAAAAV